MENKLDALRHSISHVMAAAVLELFPSAKFGIGPTIDDGFYYDFDLPRNLTPEDLPVIEEKMRVLIKKGLPFEKEESKAKDATKLFTKAKQPYKVELIKDLILENPPQPSLKGGRRKKGSPPLEPVLNSIQEGVRGDLKITIYKTGSFVDLCRGPHIKSTDEINPDAFRLTKIAGAYWRGSEKNKMLQRVYGTAWASKKDLDEYLKKIEEAEKRDHRKIGKELDLFSFHDVAPGMPFFHPKGAIIYNELRKFWIDSQKEFNYDMVLCPSMLDVSIWKQSGHWDHYKDDMYFIKADKDEKVYALRPMDCPGAILIYNNSPKSYRDLPLRYAEPGLITRKEKSGQLAGLFRVQQFVQDDAHMFMTEEQIESEIKGVIALVDKVYRAFGIPYKAYLSTRPDSFLGDVQTWDKAENALKKILKDVYGNDYGLKEKDGAFYGPKIDYQLTDCLGRTWQCATIQLDFQMPGKFGCEYTDNQGQKKQPVLVHRTIMGSFERFMGILTEHYAGAFPVWLAPEQVWVLPIGSRHEDYANKVAEKLRQEDIRVVVKSENETIGKKIRDGENQKIPYLLIVGDKEMAADSVAVRQRGKGDLGAIKLADFTEKIIAEIKDKK